jgi:2-polyprenyl-3-methyl-5-hydroxy-6-metoxy-1,4-benzoquinol methylase
MDTATFSFEQFRNCLRELEIINHLTLAYRPTLQWLRRVMRGRELRSLLDVGSGGGDMLRQITQTMPQQAASIAMTGVDLNPWSRQAAAAHKAAVPLYYETMNIFDYPPTRQFDVIISSLFTHHLDETQLVNFLRWMEAHATAGWFINDLHRHWLPYYFIKLTTRLFSRDPMIRHDAAVSVARSFKRDDWQRLLRQAGLADTAVRIRWYFPFRLCVERMK